MPRPRTHAAPVRSALATTTAAAAITLGAGFTAPASADLIESVWFGPNDFAIRINHMPDFDQRRRAQANPPVIGLPNDGSMYCVPTSVVNLAGYAANHGHPSVLQPSYWQGAGQYDTITNVLILLGILGPTSPTNGTTLDGMHRQATAMMNPALFNIITDGADQFWAPKVSDLAKMVRDGGIVSFCHGWYSFEDNLVQRNGGHCITFTRAYDDAFFGEIWARDPADVPNDSVQSTFVERKYDFFNNLYVTTNGDIRVMSRMWATPNESAVRLIDGYCLVRPRWMAAFPPGTNGLVIDYATQIFEGFPTQVLFDSPDNVSAIVAGPAQDVLYAAAVGAFGGNALFCTDIASQAWAELPVPLPPNPVFELANDRCLLVLGDGELQKILLDAEVPDIIASQSVPTDWVMTFDRSRSEVVLLDPNARRIITRPQDLQTPGQLFSLPPGKPFSPETVLSWCEANDLLWILDPNADQRIWSAVRGADGFVDIVPLEGLEELEILNPTFLKCDDQGHLLVLDDGVWAAIRPQEDGTWVRDTDSPFDGKPGDRRTIFSENRTNHDPAIHRPEEWINVLPEVFAPGLPDCDADLNLDRVVDTGDLLRLLAAWGDCPIGAYCDADLNGDGAVATDDLLRLLAAWGDCPDA